MGGSKGQWNENELLAVEMGIHALCQDTNNMHLGIQVDNTTAVAYLKDMGGRTRECNDIVPRIWLWCKDRNIWLSASHLPGKSNVEADRLSRLNHRCSEWKLKVEIFDKIVNIFGLPDIDLFAICIMETGPDSISHRCFLNTMGRQNILCIPAI